MSNVPAQQNTNSLGFFEMYQLFKLKLCTQLSYPTLGFQLERSQKLFRYQHFCQTKPNKSRTMFEPLLANKLRIRASSYSSTPRSLIAGNCSKAFERN